MARPPMILYIAGPMSGKPRYNFDEFDRVAERLTAAGHAPVSPTEITRNYWEYTYGYTFDPAVDKCEWGSDDLHKLIKLDFNAVLHSDGIVLLDGWTGSRGAVREAVIAEVMGLPFFVLRAEGLIPYVVELGITATGRTRIGAQPWKSSEQPSGSLPSSLSDSL